MTVHTRRIVFIEVPGSNGLIQYCTVCAWTFHTADANGAADFHDKWTKHLAEVTLVREGFGPMAEALAREGA